MTMELQQRWTIGLVGGMSWESTALYYRRLNEAMQQRRGEYRNARSLVATMEFHDLMRAAAEDRWDDAGAIVVKAARQLESAGADFIVLTSVTGHALAAAVRESIDIPLLHISDSVGRAARTAGWQRIGLMGTRFTMDRDFFHLPLQQTYALATAIPSSERRTEIHRIIIEELTLGRFNESSRTTACSVAEQLVADGSDGVVLACTELPLLLTRDTLRVPSIDAVEAHVAEIVDAALDGRIPQ